MRARGEPLTSIALADGLIAYSERGQAYVDTLKGIIRVNNLEIADSARAARRTTSLPGRCGECRKTLND